MVLLDKAYKEMILSEAYRHETYYMGMVDEHNKVNFYDGLIRIVRRTAPSCASSPATNTWT